MNFKTTFLFATTLIAAVSGQGLEVPECTIGVDTESCTTPSGKDGYFIHVTDSSSNLRPSLGSFSNSHCVSLDASERFDGSGEWALGPYIFYLNRDTVELECGCKDEVCPIPLTCPCLCELTIRYGITIEGSTATLMRNDGSSVNGCFPPIHVDAGRLICHYDCIVVVNDDDDF